MESQVELIGYVGALLVFLAFWMRRMVPLRIVAIGSNVAFLGYGLATGATPVWVLHVVLLPLNLWRLQERLRILREVRRTRGCGISVEWLAPIATRRSVTAGEIVFRRDEVAREMYYVASGRLRSRELDLAAGPGCLVGELGLLAPGRRRPQTLQCIESGTLLAIPYDKVEQLCRQHPSFGSALLRLSASHLFERIDRLEHALAGHERPHAHGRSTAPRRHRPRRSVRTIGAARREGDIPLQSTR